MTILNQDGKRRMIRKGILVVVAFLEDEKLSEWVTERVDNERHPHIRNIVSYDLKSKTVMIEDYPNPISVDICTAYN